MSGILQVVPVRAYSGDIYFGSVILLLNGQGSHGGTTILDESSYAHVPATSSGVTTSTTNPLYGVSSLEVSTTGRVSYTRSSLFEFDTDLWTLEGKMYPTAVDATRRSVTAFLFDGGNNTAWDFDFTSSDSRVRVGAGGSSVVTLNPATPPVVNTWVDYAICRDTGGVIRFYYDGVQISSGTMTGGGAAVMTVPTVSANTRPDLFNGSNQTEQFVGRMYARWTRGVCRYPGGASYVPPVGPYPNSL